MTDDQAWVGNFNWTRTGATGRIRPPFGVYHRTPVQPCIAALFIPDTGAATWSRRAGPPSICAAAFAPARYERAQAGRVTSTSSPNQI